MTSKDSSLKNAPLSCHEKHFCNYAVFIKQLEQEVRNFKMCISKPLDSVELFIRYKKNNVPEADTDVTFVLRLPHKLQRSKLTCDV